MLTQEQKRIRMRGCGGSDVNALSGASRRWRPIDVYMSKVDASAEQCISEDQALPGESDENMDTMRGDFLEPAVRNWYAYVQRAHVTEPGTIFHPEHRRILATPDGLVKFADGRPQRGLEIKCPRFSKVADWCPGKWPQDVQVPSYYLPQVTVEAAVLGVESVDVAVLLGDELRIINVPFDRVFFDRIVTLVNTFWEKCVETRTPPPPDYSDSYGKFLRARYPKPKDDMMQPDDVMLREARAYFDAGQKIKALEDIQSAARNYLQHRMQDARGCQFGPGAKVLWTCDSDKPVVDYPALIKELNVSRETVEKHTTIKPGVRKFRPYFNGWKS